MRRSLVGTPLLPVPPPSGGRVPRTPHDGTTADDTHAIMGTTLLPVPPPLPPPTPSGGRGRVPRTPHDGTAAEATHAIIRVAVDEQSPAALKPAVSARGDMLRARRQRDPSIKSSHQKQKSINSKTGGEFTTVLVFLLLLVRTTTLQSAAAQDNTPTSRGCPYPCYTRHVQGWLRAREKGGMVRLASRCCFLFSLACIFYYYCGFVTLCALAAGTSNNRASRARGSTRR